MAKQKYLKILDSKGRPIKTSQLYATPSNFPGKYKQRFGTTLQDYDKEVTVGNRDEMLRYSRQIFAQMPQINNCILQKSQYAAGSAWQPTFIGQDKKWGQLATDFLVSSWYPVASTQGFDFVSCLKMASINLDVDGDILMVMVKSKSGFPMVQFIESHRIGCRSYSDTVVASGKYRGLQIVNGVIKNSTGRPVAYRVLGATADDDVDISARDCKLILDPIHFSMTRGLPRLATAILDSMDLDDIESFLKQAVKIESRVALIRQNPSGEAAVEDGNIIIDSQVEPDGATPVEQSLPNYEVMHGGEVLYIDSESDIKPMDAIRPSPNTIEFIRRIESRILDSVGWPLYLITQTGGAGTRATQELFRSTIASRQNSLWTPAKLAVNFAIVNAMSLGLVPQNNGDWWNWDFVFPVQFSVDQGYERAANINDYKLGIRTLDDLSGEQGKRWQDIRGQISVETEDLLTRAQELVTKYGVTLDYAVNLLSQRSPNPPPLPVATV